jgi:predicted alpha-1,6-mannanase (GH76 family)
MEKRKSTGRRHHAYVFYFLLLIASYQSFSQHSIYTPVAGALQANTHYTFLSSDGKYYLHNNAGNTFFNYWWQAHGMDVLLDAYLRTRNDVYKQRMKNLLLGTKDKNGGLYPTHYYDDMAWLAIASLRAYQNTNDAEYMTALQALWRDMKTGQHAGRGGALQWNNDAPHSLNACTNGPAIIFATRLYRINGNAQDLQTAKDIYTWMKGALIDPVNGAVWDSYNDSTNHTNKDWIFSYNVGTWIGAGLELYKVTGEQVYLDDAVKTAEYAMTKRLYNGVLWANETGDGDGGLFKGIFLRYLDQLAREGNIPPATRDRYINALKSTAQKVNTVAINKTNWLVNKDWNVTAETVTDYSTQLSGIMIMELASNFDKAFFFKDYNYGGYTAALVPGRYTKAQLNAMGILDNDISSLTVPKGYTVTVYVNDNFSGTSTTFTANTSYVGASWNDTISSLVISAAATPLHK